MGIDYYCGDSGGLNIDYAAGPSTAAFPTNSYNTGTKIERLALDLMWYVYDTFTTQGRSVDFVGHSMGGLIIRYGLVRVAAGDPAFPPSVLVDDVVTVSTPYDGVDIAPSPLTPTDYTKVWCGSYAECAELTPGSPFLLELQADEAQWQGAVAGEWTTIGGSPKDIMTDRSSSDIAPAEHVAYPDKNHPGYKHTNYMTDVSAAHDVPVRYTATDGTVTSTAKGPHSLESIAAALSASDG